MSEPTLDVPWSDRAALFMRVARHVTALSKQIVGDDSLRDTLQRFSEEVAQATRGQGQAQRDPLERLQLAYGLRPTETDAVALALMPELHEGLAQALRKLHPDQQPQVTFGLVLQILGGGFAEREQLRSQLELGTAAKAGLLRIGEVAALDARNLEPAQGLLDLLLGNDVWPAALGQDSRTVPLAGLEEWMGQPDVQLAARALRSKEAVTVCVRAPTEGLAVERAAALAQIAGLPFVRLTAGETLPGLVALACLHARLRGLTPIVFAAEAASLAEVDRQPFPVVVATTRASRALEPRRRHIEVGSAPLGHKQRAALWSALLPESPDLARRAAAVRVEGADAIALAEELRTRAGSRSDTEGLEASRDVFWAHESCVLPSSVTLVSPRADGPELVLPAAKQQLLEDALERWRHQATVFDEWNILPQRRGVRGVRALFVGPPGTGKTLAAEAVARRLGAQLLIIDLSQVASKWLGETEKNLEQAFTAAERTGAVLMFDEADALFGARTRVASANDRYANLETAYLLQRLERFEGMTILTTNLRQNVDSAFLRRFELVLEFEEPAARERQQLWRLHLGDAPREAKLDLQTIATAFPLSGGGIKNAALAAAFKAAVRGDAVTTTDIAAAVKAELEKIGRPFPGAIA